MRVKQNQRRKRRKLPSVSQLETKKASAADTENILNAGVTQTPKLSQKPFFGANLIAISLGVLFPACE
jgi:hypothetical protein